MILTTLRSLCCALALGLPWLTAVAAGAAPDAAARTAAAAEVQALMRQGDLPAALLRARTASEAEPGNPGLRFVQGVILLDLKRDTEALALFIGLTQEFPALSEPYNNIALLHARAGHWDAARVALEDALRNDPGYRIARENLGDVHLQLALLAWDTAASGPAGSAPNAPLQRKLRLGRDLAQANSLAAEAAGPTR